MTPNWCSGRCCLPDRFGVRHQAVRHQRTKVVPLAHGQVLEIGIGTGLNMRHYDKSRIASLTGLDPALEMHKLAQKRIRRAGLRSRSGRSVAERIPRADASFDTVIVTYACARSPTAGRAGEMRRVWSPAAS